MAYLLRLISINVQATIRSFIPKGHTYIRIGTEEYSSSEWPFLLSIAVEFRFVREDSHAAHQNMKHRPALKNRGELRRETEGFSECTEKSLLPSANTVYKYCT
jgi:hypothetical protein